MSKKNLIAVVVILTGISASFFIYRGSPKGADGYLTSFSEGGANPNFQFESAKNLYPNAIGPGGGGGFPATDNLTELLARAYAQDILENVQPGSDGVLQGNLNLSSLNLTTEDLQKKIGQGLEFRKFELNVLKISEDNSQKSQIAYMEAVDSLLRKNLGGFKKSLIIALDEFFQRNDPASLNYLVDNIPRYLNGLLELEVPSSWQDYHLRTLDLWHKKLVTYKAILEKNDDPLKTYLAIQYLPEIAEEDLSLQATLTKSYEELK